MTKQFLLYILFLLTTSVAAQDATIEESTQSFPTYPFSDPSPLPLLNNVYPYFRYDGFTDKPVAKQWKVITLQNKYLTLLILPEIGGKIWTAIIRSTNKPFIYYNHTVKFRDVAMRGPWTSGGLESNFGIIGHTPNCATPVDYTNRTNPDGSVSCIIGTLDLLSRSYWRMEIRLPKDEARFSTRAYWYNTTALEQPYYHWMNAGLKAGNDLEFIYPGNRYLGHNGEYADWPVNEKNGKNISWYKNNDFGSYKSYHVFGKYTDFSGAYWHNDDYGMVRYATHDEKAGKKLWIWGLSGEGMIWEKLLTDTDGQYIELQSGRLFNQNTANSTATPFKHRGFMPYESDTWEEYWYPVLGTNGFVTANADGALNIEARHGWIKFSFCPTRTFTDTLSIFVNGKPIYTKALSFQPLHPITDSIKADSDHIIAALRVSHLFYDSYPTAGNLTRPVDAPADFNFNTAYGNYIKAMEAIDQKNYPIAETALAAALEKDPNFTPALTAMANLLYRNMRYKEALQHATHAIAINTEDGHANLIYGLINEALGNTLDAKDGFDIATLDPATRSAAYTCLARLSLKDQDNTRAIQQAKNALINNALNMEALQLMAVAARPNNRSFLALIDSLDPLNAFSHFERNKQSLSSLIRNELPDQTYLELAIWYYNIGHASDALEVLQLAPPTAEIKLWIAHLTGKPFDWQTIDPTRSFPFRSETGVLLEKAPQNWFVKYQLALIYHDRTRIAEAQQLLQSCGDTPNFAPFYAFRAQLLHNNALNDLKKARSLDSSWRYQKLLTEYYLKQGDSLDALAIIEPFYTTHPDHNTMGILYAKTLLLNNQLQKADKLFAQLNVLPAEGATSAREIYREVKLRQAEQEIKKKNYKKAKTLIAEAKKYPENLGSGAPYPADQDTRREDSLLQSMDHTTAQTGTTAQIPTSGNPIFPGWYADPEAAIFNKTYWVYPTYSDKYNKQVFFDAFSSTDLLHWTKHEKILDTTAIHWAHRAMWAPAITKKDNKYYFFFAANDIQNDSTVGGIGVAFADKPEGPYKDYLQKPLIDKFHNGAQPIDQAVFQDKDGQYYMIYGGWRHCNITKLKSDFTGFEPFPDGTTFKEITPKDYVEGPWMFTRNGKYYFMWSEGGWTGPDYSVAYAIADKPTGPFQRIGKILQQDTTVATGAGHNSVIHIPNTDDYYIVYHRHPLGDKDGNHRVTCVDRMYFDADGRIQPVKITKAGITARPLK